jgi:hypothetical protein
MSIDKPSIGHLEKAKLARVKILDSLDKYVAPARPSSPNSSRAITVVHLLTNSQWGEGVPPTRFLSCRQSVPARDRASVVGDISVFTGALSETASTSRSIASIKIKTSRMNNILQALREAKFLTRVHCGDSGLEIQVELVPSTNPMVGQSGLSTCRLSVNKEPITLTLHPLLRRLVSTRANLRVTISRTTENMDTCEGSGSNSAVTEYIVSRVVSAQAVALDYLVLQRLHEEADKGKAPLGWVITKQTKQSESFRLSAVKMKAGDAVYVTVELVSKDDQVTPRHSRAEMMLKQAYVDACMRRGTPVSLFGVLDTALD